VHGYFRRGTAPGRHARVRDGRPIYLVMAREGRQIDLAMEREGRSTDLARAREGRRIDRLVRGGWRRLSWSRRHGKKFDFGEVARRRGGR